MESISATGELTECYGDAEKGRASKWGDQKMHHEVGRWGDLFTMVGDEDRDLQGAVMCSLNRISRSRGLPMGKQREKENGQLRECAHQKQLK